MMQQIDFTGCPRVAGRAYNGANGKKIAYYDFLHSDAQPAMLLAVREELQPKMAAMDVETLIDETPYLIALQREFYVTYLNARREKLFD